MLPAQGTFSEAIGFILVLAVVWIVIYGAAAMCERVVEELRKRQ